MTPERKANRMKVEIKGSEMVITIPINAQPSPSNSGKTLLVATTHGNIPSTATINGQPVIVSVNAYIRRN